ncbi:hypothetical protein [Sandaracinus amylolyticus]|uniref:Uncharacterized protein n=1 Tax=Sandaracinus amylolyticus TaxID=927083 RepID=A0A0F6W3M7_9BACT|nr:hypothetical protein [Sandaracinus amylolyticus]AKF06465.1 hypothetical protein DB32_003614 [Sandaracinus amylolyticus]
MPEKLVAIPLSVAMLVSATAVADDDAGVAPRVRWERPPEGTIERGIFGVPEWLIVVVGALVVAASALALVRAMRRSR